MKGFILSMEALVAVGIMVLVAVFLSGITMDTNPELRYERLYMSAKDVLNILENARIYETEGLEVLDQYIEDGVILDRNGTLLDAIGYLWASGNITLAENLTREVLEKVFNGSGYNYQLILGNATVYQKNASSASFVAKLSTVVSGYDVGKPVSGYVSRAYITNPSKQDTKYVFFGGYVGDGNITQALILSNLGTVLSAEMEMDAGSNFTLYINGNYSGTYLKNTTSTLLSQKWTIAEEYLDSFFSGQNIIGINFTGNRSYIGGGVFKVTYNTTDLVVSSEAGYGENATGNYTFPGIRGIINLFDSFYVPGNLTNLSIYLDYHSGYEVFLTVGNVTIHRSNESSRQQVTINDSYLSGLMNYSWLSEATVPIRFGTENISLEAGLGTLDTSLITDRSPSMGACDVDVNCTDPGNESFCDTDPTGGCHDYRAAVAIDADVLFIEEITSNSGNSVGLVGYGEIAAPSCSVFGMSGSNSSLQAHIEDYYANGTWQRCGYTCISCGIESATVQLTENEALHGLRKVRDIDTDTHHVGDLGPVSKSIELELDLEPSRFVKGKLSILATNTDVVDGYKDCIFLNDHYLGRVCKSDGTGQDQMSWHTCLYPLRTEWLKDGKNNVTVTGATTESCFDEGTEPNDQDDWDFKDVELVVWEANSQPPSSATINFSGDHGMNSEPSYSLFADLWEYVPDRPYPVDFGSGSVSFNSSENTFGLLGEASGDDGWDWSAGEYGGGDDVVFYDVLDAYDMLLIGTRTVPGYRNNCPGYDCSAAYGIQFEVTDDIYSEMLLGKSIYVSFNYSWSGSGFFEDEDEVWIKGRLTTPAGSHWLGSDFDSGHDGADGDPDIMAFDEPDSSFDGFFFQDISPWISGAGTYYLDFGGKILADSSLEWGYFGFDDIAVGVSETVPAANKRNFTFAADNKTGIEAAMAEFGAIGIDLDYYDCLLLNGNLVGRVDQQKWNGSDTWHEVLFDLPVAWLDEGNNTLTFTGGTEYGCERIGTHDSWTIRDLNVTLTRSGESHSYERTKTMLIMSDGAANTKIGDCAPYGSPSCPQVPGAELAYEETIRKACEAFNEYGIRVFAVAFGDAGSMAIYTLNESAGCDDYDNFYTSNSKDDLLEIYSRIAQQMINISFKGQTAVISGNVSLNNTLYPDSRIMYDYVSTLPDSGFGEVTFSFESLPFRNYTGNANMTDNLTGTKEGQFFIIPDVDVISARVTSYSSGFWTDRLYMRPDNASNYTRVYWLDNYGSDYSKLGDPYNVHIPSRLVGVGGTNYVKLGVGTSPLNGSGGSPDAKVIYTLRIDGLNLEGYSGVYPKSEGSTVRVYYDLDGDNATDSSSTIAYGSNPGDVFDPQSDSIDDAFMRLLDNLNVLYDRNPSGYGDGSEDNPHDGLNDTNPIDLAISSEVLFDSSSISGIKSIWGPAELVINVWV